MKKTTAIPIVVITLLLVLALSACGSLGKKSEAPAEQPQVIIITATPKVEAPVVTEPPAVVVTEPPAPPTEPPALPTEPPAAPPTAPPAGGEKYFLDEFDNGMDNYSHFIFDYNSFRTFKDSEALERKAGVEVEDGKVKFNMETFGMTYFFVYEPQTYEDVKISIEMQNLGYASSTSGLICRYDEDMGWYEALLDAQGQWALYYYDAVTKGYTYLTNGGAEVFNYGKDTNKFTLACEGKNLSIYVNDVFSQTYEHKDLKSGKVGFSGSAEDSYTYIHIPWFEVSEP
ncbi:MAG TPA: hypothetical protein PKK59_03415 [Anaerolineaceae bacterium]|nr:hypothetical protein [Anaerolineaceae bacterium]